MISSDDLPQNFLIRDKIFFRNNFITLTQAVKIHIIGRLTKEILFKEKWHLNGNLRRKVT